MARIVISYRRADADADAGRLYDNLKPELGDAALFYDVDDVPPGEDVRRAIAKAIDESTGLILVIGPHWMARDKRDRLRLASGNDPIRLEIELARACGLPILPIWVRGTDVPDAEELPEGMEWLWPPPNRPGRRRSHLDL